MKITMDIARKVLAYVRQGLTGGMGDGEREGDMCVQHAVSRATGGTGTEVFDDDKYVANDQPSCVAGTLRSLGIDLNDAVHWESDAQRAKGLQRFAVAELGTASSRYRFDEEDFVKRMNNLVRTDLADILRKQWELEVPGEIEDYAYTNINIDDLSAKDLKRYADGIASVLEKMKTPGSEFLCMVDWTTKDLQKPLEDETK